MTRRASATCTVDGILSVKDLRGHRKERTEREGEHVGQCPASPEGHVELRCRQQEEVFGHFGTVRTPYLTRKEGERERIHVGENEADCHEERSAKQALHGGGGHVPIN